MEDVIIRSINAHIASYLAYNGKKINWLAEQLGISRLTFYNKRKGVTDWRLSEVVKLSEIMDVSLDTLAGLN